MPNNPKVEVGDTIRIVYMDGEPTYNGKEGVVRTIDCLGHIHGTWGWCGLIPTADIYELVKKGEK